MNAGGLFVSGENQAQPGEFGPQKRRLLKKDTGCRATPPTGRLGNRRQFQSRAGHGGRRPIRVSLSLSSKLGRTAVEDLLGRLLCMDGGSRSGARDLDRISACCCGVSARRDRIGGSGSLSSPFLLLLPLSTASSRCSRRTLAPLLGAGQTRASDATTGNKEEEVSCGLNADPS